MNNHFKHSQFLGRMEVKEFRTWAVREESVIIADIREAPRRPHKVQSKGSCQGVAGPLRVVTVPVASRVPLVSLCGKTLHQRFIYTLSSPRSLISYYVGKYLKLNMLPVELNMLNYPSFSLWLFSVAFPILQNMLLCSGIEHIPKPSRGLWNLNFFLLRNRLSKLCSLWW